MRARAFLLLLLFSSVPAFPQCSLTPIFSGQFRASYLDVSVDGNDLWAATGYGLQLFDRTVDPPALIATLAIPGTTRVVRAKNGIAYTGSGSSIYVVRRAGKTLEIVRSTDAGATVNDLLTATYLFAATANGIAQFDIVDVTNPIRTSATLPTSSANVASLSVASSTLYAADGDSTLELFSIASPAAPTKIGTLPSRPSTVAVHATTSRVYASDAFNNTDVFIGGTKASTLSIGSTSLAQISGDELFVATDRKLRAVDFTLASQPVELFLTEIAPTSGTINRISAMQLAGSRLYVAAGDMGLLTYDVSQFTKPHAVHGYAIGAFATPVISGDRGYIADGLGAIREQSISANGDLFTTRTWNGGTRVHDAANNFILTSTSAVLTYSTLISTTPTQLWTATLRAPIRSAVLSGSKAIALLTDDSVWSLNAADAAPVAQQVDLGGAKIIALARSDATLALVESRDSGATSVVRYYADGNLSGTPQTANVSGITTALAVGSGKVAVFAFQGISVISFPLGSTTLLKVTNGLTPIALAFDGTKLLELDNSGFNVWSLTSNQKIRDYRFASFTFGMAIGSQQPIAIVTTSDGAMSIAYNSASEQPQLEPRANGNLYYRKAAASDGRLYLQQPGGAIDIYSTALGSAPHWINTITSSALDFAVSADGVFTMFGSGLIRAYSRDGYQIAETLISEGIDSQPLAIHTAGRAPWVSLSTGCQTAGCEKKTFILDPATLATTMTLNGGIVDLAAPANRVYAIFDLPAEVRIYDLGNNPQHPVIAATRAAEGAPKSIAAANGTVYVLGDVLRPYNESLTPLTTIEPGGTVDTSERIRINGTCSVVTGRTFDPIITGVPGWTAGPVFRIPSATKSLAAAAGRFVVLTDTSIEIWSSTPVTPPKKRHATR
ncbi:MAG TPA: hypothetical protein VMU84_14430 [Thermoanaerobaculia bacterium]|nr:hypothetical protein [Thermoanaerobaculia bacterium]